VSKHNCNKLEENKCLKHRDANLRWIRSSLLSSIVVMLFQKDEAYFNIDLPKVTCKNNKLSMVEKESCNVRISAKVFSDLEKIMINVIMK
jgi:hypothetical protein